MVFCFKSANILMVLSDLSTKENKARMKAEVKSTKPNRKRKRNDASSARKKKAKDEHENTENLLEILGNPTADNCSKFIKDLSQDVLYHWMASFGLLKKPISCSESNCRGSEIIWFDQPKLRDKATWNCLECNNSMPVRAGSFFANLKCELKTALTIIEGWCDEQPEETFAQKLGVKLQLVKRIYQLCAETIQAYVMDTNVVGKQAPEWLLGGKDSVVLVDVWPHGTVPAPSNSNESKRRLQDRLKILWLADTKCVPVRYWAWILPIFNPLPKKPNETPRKRTKEESKRNVQKKEDTERERSEEMSKAVANFVEMHIAKESFVVVNETTLPNVCHILRSTGYYEGVQSIDNLLSLNSEEHQPTLSILENIWKSAASVCKELQAATRTQGSRKLSEFLWRQQFHGSNSEKKFYYALRHITSHFHLRSNIQSTVAEPEH